MNDQAPLRTDVATFARLTGWEYFPIAFIGRLPFAMMIVGILTFVTTVRGSVAEAGLAAACAGIGTAACGPVVGSLADRVSQRAVLLVCSAVSILATALLLVLVGAGAPLLAVLAIAFVAGGATPQVAPFSRSRLVVFAGTARSTVTRGRAVSMVMSYESVMDEASFVIGPVLVGILTTLIAPWAPLVTGAILTATIVVAFALHHSGRAVAQHSPSEKPLDGSVFSARILLLAAGMLLVGSVFGSILTALTEFMTARGIGEQTGIAYGAMSVGAIVVAVSVAALPRRFTLPARWIAFGGLGLVGAIALLLADSLIATLVALFLSGCGIGAVLVVLFSLGAEAAPAGRSTTVLTTLQSTLVVGQALATAAGGLVAQEFGSAAGYGITAASAVMLVALAMLYRWRFERAVGTDRLVVAD
ncbi:MFS transporter [Leifsonia kafniensis]|uniref:MFS transporter n=1 Tax=Leifsonia kafniensis TaxID=475957 RepID=A0ABP7KNM0_9MICO